MNHHPLPDKYVAALNVRDTYVLAIMGKDPYPTDAVGIPFCKPTWGTFCVDGVSGLDVFRSLGVDVEKARKKYKEPCDFFIYLAVEKGIIFLNLSYHYLASKCRKNSHDMQLKSAERINRQYLLASKNIVLCGEADKIRWYQNDYQNLHKAVHPDTRCKISRFEKVGDCWQKWWSENALKIRFKIII